MKNTIILITLITFLLSIKAEGQNTECRTITLNPNHSKKEMLLSEIADSVIIIPLETKQECIMGTTVKMIIKNKYIYALDVKQDIVFVFNKKGEFIAKLNKKGRGPAEYSNLRGLFVDDDEKQISVINGIRNGKHMTYSNISFNFKSQIESPYFSADATKRFKSAIFAAGNQCRYKLNGEIKQTSILKIKNGKIEKTYFDKKYETNGHFYGVFTESFTINDQNELFASIIFDNTFYKYKNDDFVPILKVDFDGHGINNAIQNQSTREQLEYLENTSHLASCPVLNINNSNIMSFTYHKGAFVKSKSHYIEFKKSKKTFHVQKIKNDITSFPKTIGLHTDHGFINHEIWHNDYLVDIVNLGYYFAEDETMVNVKGVGKISIEDNPVIVLIKLKDNL